MKIMILADVHINKAVEENRKKITFNALKNAFKTIPCDLAVFLGDLIHGPDYGNDRESFINDLRNALKFTGNVPFAYVFGNHDSEGAVSKEEILKIVGENKNSLTNGENYVLKMNGETLLFIDSGSEYDGPESCYDVVKPNVINWAKEQIKGEKAILFQHIIIPDIRDVIEQDDNGVFRFKDGVDYTGEMNEEPCPPDINTGELEILSPYLKAMVFGHDHINNFECELKGVKIIQCSCTSVNGYEYPEYQQPTVRLLDTETMTTEIINV
ncbi:MAG: hypothetical protein E7515_01420 [Ruminococcaceae bacterium]|nr:hypothetical protein [Oscillospiraceae bacterium]